MSLFTAAFCRYIILLLMLRIRRTIGILFPFRPLPAIGRGTAEWIGADRLSESGL